MTQKELRKLTSDYEILYSFVHGETYYDKRGLVTWFIVNDICFVNSYTVNNEKFTKAMLKQIKELISTYDKIVISSSLNNLKYLLKLGFKYNSYRETYERGVIYG